MKSRTDKLVTKFQNVVSRYYYQKIKYPVVCEIEIYLLDEPMRDHIEFFIEDRLDEIN